MRPNKQGLYKCIVPIEKAKVGIKFNTIPNKEIDKYDFIIKKVTKQYFTVCDKNDCIYVLCQYIGEI